MRGAEAVALDEEDEGGGGELKGIASNSAGSAGFAVQGRGMSAE